MGSKEQGLTMDYNPDKIDIYKDENGEFRWTRKTDTNFKIVGASSQGYTRLKYAMDNIERTQKTPFVVNFTYKGENFSVFVDS